MQVTNTSYPLFEDRIPALDVTKRRNADGRTKHIAVLYRFIRQEVEKGSTEAIWISTQQQVADGFTKALARTKFEHLRPSTSFLDCREVVDQCAHQPCPFTGY